MARGDVVMGVDRIAQVASENSADGRHVIRGDAFDVEYWRRFCLDPRTELLVLGMSDRAANLVAVRRVKEFLPQVRIAATATHTDEIMELEHEGVDVARNLYGEPGQALADDACDLLHVDPPTNQEP